MAIRKIIQIDEEKCNGCGLCIPNCAEGAIQIVNGKAKLIHDKYCDGLGACLGHCPQDALKLIEREADEFDEQAVEELLASQRANGHHHPEVHNPQHHRPHAGGCPGSRLRNLEEEKPVEASRVSSGDIEVKIKSQLTQWPVQLKLVPPSAPYLPGADLLVTADCVPFAYPNYHLDLLKGKKVVVGCPKLDDIGYYVEKLTAMFKQNDLKSITVAFMEVPCCTGIVRAVETALANSGKDIPVHKVKIGIGGEKITAERL
ncbi:ATP-binding protein [Zhaonella formicivorans]|uniref:ATP-binding protein n=1 Tax=Zhaonella formicivorans TaxID=2528593 RepID=UPI0010ED19B0|nr:4Fe-4S binding protein [Zhaonella formicivorans]